MNTQFEHLKTLEIAGGRATLHLGDCLEVMKTMATGSVDSIVCDPPAGIGFMGKAWDSDKGGRDAWIAWLGEVMKEALRVLKPGGHALVWAIPRTSHWTATALENAGFEVRDRIAHVFGSAMPKSLSVDKAIDRMFGAERPVIGKGASQPAKSGHHAGLSALGRAPEERFTPDITAPATDAAKAWQGWGTALKPAVEDWWLVRKPLIGTVAKNVLEFGTGAINIGACRVGDEVVSVHNAPGGTFAGGEAGRGSDTSEYREHVGRWPANMTHDGSEEVEAGFPSTKEGSASRFFYCAKASRKDRGEGNNHPTVKAEPLCRYLVRMITPPNGLVLDMFAGAGSTGKAAILEGFRFVGIERELDYLEIAAFRITAAAESMA